MTRINVFSKTAETRDCVAWGKNLSNKTTIEKSGVLFFAALLIVCSLAVGCSNDKPKPVTSNNQIPVTPSTAPETQASSIPAPAEPAKPVVKKVVHKRPATVTYSDKTYGVTFEYPRRYAIETGNAATELVSSSPLPMNFVMPGGTALAAVELPETGFANTDFSSAFFNVSVNKSVSADDCGKFSVPAPEVSQVETPKANAEDAKVEVASAQSSAPSTTPVASTDQTASSNQSVDATPVKADAAASTQPSSLLLSDMQMQKAEAVTGEGNRQSDSKYVHVYQNGACYEFAMNVTTVAAKTDASMKHVDRDKVFTRLEQILSTVKINPIAAQAPEVTASAPAAPAASPDAATPTATTASTPADNAPAAQAVPANPTTSNQ